MYPLVITLFLFYRVETELQKDYIPESPLTLGEIWYKQDFIFFSTFVII